MNHGICVNGECVCDGPFEGDQCEIGMYVLSKGNVYYIFTCLYIYCASVSVVPGLIYSASYNILR